MLVRDNSPCLDTVQLIALTRRNLACFPPRSFPSMLLNHLQIVSVLLSKSMGSGTFSQVIRSAPYWDTKLYFVTGSQDSR